jgi:putative transposase
LLPKRPKRGGQTVKAAHAPGGGGYDPAERSQAPRGGGHGRATADQPDHHRRAGRSRGEAIAEGVRRRWPWLKHLSADGADDRGWLASPAAYRDLTLEVVRRLPDQKGFQVLPQR